MLIERTPLLVEADSKLRRIERKLQSNPGDLATAQTWAAEALRSGSHRWDDIQNQLIQHGQPERDTYRAVHERLVNGDHDAVNRLYERLGQAEHPHAGVVWAARHQHQFNDAYNDLVHHNREFERRRSNYQQVTDARRRALELVRDAYIGETTHGGRPYQELVHPLQGEPMHDHIGRVARVLQITGYSSSPTHRFENLSQEQRRRAESLVNHHYGDTHKLVTWREQKRDRRGYRSHNYLGRIIKRGARAEEQKD